MSFRGVLLRLDEAAGDAAFRVVAPDAALVVPGASAAVGADQRVVASDAATGKLLSVARFSCVSPRPALRAALWVATEAPKDASSNGGDAGAAAVAARWPAAELAPPAAAARVCFCFFFRSDFELDLFARAAQAYANAQRLSLLHSSVLIELQVQRDVDATSNAGLQAAADAATRALEMKSKGPAGAGTDPPVRRGRGRPRTRDRAGNQENGAKRTSSASTAPTTATASTITSPRYSRAELDAIPPAGSKVENVRSEAATGDQKEALASNAEPEAPQCIMCRFSPKADAESHLKDHPFVLQDGRGRKIRVCKVCLQKVLQRRLNVTSAAGGGPLVAATAGLCNLCSEPTGSLPKSKVKQCVHEMCKSTYCAPCIVKLIGKAQAHKVWRVKQWLCTNCTTFQDAPAIDPNAQSLSHESTASAPTGPKDASRRNKKRKRLPIPPAEEEPSLAPPTIAPASESASAEAIQEPLMTPMDYAASYFQFLVSREEANPPEDESEDVCFCCKDGGEVIECDWKGLNNKFARCPKVYHEDCLGYDVPEGKAWYCPRHRCHLCGILADLHCRFCVTTYCEVHLPPDVRRLGPGSADIPNATYVVCPRCSEYASKAVEQGKLPRDFHARIFLGAA